MDELTFKWILIFAPGQFELLVLSGILVLLRAVRGLLKKQTIGQGTILKLFGGFLLASGFYRTFFQEYNSLYKPPLAIMVTYAITGTLVFLMARVKFKYRLLWVSVTSSILLYVMLVIVFRNGEITQKITGVIVDKEKSLRFFNELILSDKPSKRSSLNGHHLKFYFNKPGNILTFVNQGYIKPGFPVEPNKNHMEILDYIKKKETDEYLLEIRIKYQLWSLGEIEVIALDGIKFENFKYMLNSFSGDKTISLEKILPTVDLMKIHF